MVLLGTVHQAVENFNADSLYRILTQIEPDLILFEVDSSFFTPEFKFNKTWDSNENKATVKYMNTYDVDVRPYDFTGRNTYRIKIGSRPTDDLTMELLDSLYQNGHLNAKDSFSYKEFLKVNDSLNSFAVLGIDAFNNKGTDDLAAIRQQYLYGKLKEIIDTNPIFSNTYYTKMAGDSISYSEGFGKAGEFWHLRNSTMAKNIMHFITEYQGKRIVVLNGYYHRYYLNALLNPEQKKYNFVIKNFHDL